MMKVILKIIIILILVCACFFAGSCDGFMSIEINEGVPFYLIMEDFDSIYPIHMEFSYENAPWVGISYYAQNGEKKAAVFQLDGYDPEKKIGFKLVLEKDKRNWQIGRLLGQTYLPDMNDEEYIRKAALQYEFPVLFINAYKYQDNYARGEITQTNSAFKNDLQQFFRTSEIAAWSEKGMRDGSWAKEYFEKLYHTLFGEEMLRKEARLVRLKYMQDGSSEAINCEFMLDGYDPIWRIGYKFVTEEDQRIWAKERANGNDTVPNLTQYNKIKEICMQYDYTIIFIYVPEYWKAEISETMRKEEFLSVLKELRP